MYPANRNGTKIHGDYTFIGRRLCSRVENGQIIKGISFDNHSHALKELVTVPLIVLKWGENALCLIQLCHFHLSTNQLTITWYYLMLRFLSMNILFLDLIITDKVEKFPFMFILVYQLPYFLVLFLILNSFFTRSYNILVPWSLQIIIDSQFTWMNCDFLQHLAIA